ncbi:hypothetical protein Lumi_069 [Xylophilus phage Lumi]|nr:hypothetical protein Lumi_069 [Xylophilus phage Lumi]
MPRLKMADLKKEAEANKRANYQAAPKRSSYYGGYGGHFGDPFDHDDDREYGNGMTQAEFMPDLGDKD